MPSNSKEFPLRDWRVGDKIVDGAWSYEVTAVLGEGSMGKVYKIHHQPWNQDLAVKCTRPEMFDRPGATQNFIREAETWMNLGPHPHIVTCWYVRRLGGVPRVFAEFVDGGSLADWIRTARLYAGGTDQALSRILDVAIQSAWGLAYAHQRGLVHQDVKPLNVMMTKDAIAKVTDFGLARARAAAGDRVSSANEDLLVSYAGMTPAYCSPEQATRQTLSVATDVWSWAVSVLEMFTGRVKWMAGPDAGSALKASLEAPPVGSPTPRMPERIAGLLEGCFVRTPQNRPQDMTSIAALLREIFVTETGQPYPRPVPYASGLISMGGFFMTPDSEESKELFIRKCPWCGEVSGTPVNRNLSTQTWGCVCGAVAFGAPARDFDELLDDVCAYFRLPTASMGEGLDYNSAPHWLGQRGIEFKAAGRLDRTFWYWTHRSPIGKTQASRIP